MQRQVKSEEEKLENHRQSQRRYYNKQRDDLSQFRLQTIELIAHLNEKEKLITSLYSQLDEKNRTIESLRNEPSIRDLGMSVSQLNSALFQQRF